MKDKKQHKAKLNRQRVARHRAKVKSEKGHEPYSRLVPKSYFAPLDEKIKELDNAAS